MDCCQRTTVQLPDWQLIGNYITYMRLVKIIDDRLLNWHIPDVNVWYSYTFSGLTMIDHVFLPRSCIVDSAWIADLSTAELEEYTMLILKHKSLDN